MGKDMKRHFREEDIEVGNKSKKRCFLSLAIREMEIKTTMRYRYVLTRMARMTNSDNRVIWLERVLLVPCQSCSEVMSERIQSREWTLLYLEEPAVVALTTSFSLCQPHHPQCSAIQGQVAFNSTKS